ncbi:hypothetical protein [Streptomyces sp. NPDC001250]|uniref:hypothetical protein n=1 Tax=unclassified Streptomyces TaxID=2593676 RepID=UPI003320E111
MTFAEQVDGLTVRYGRRTPQLGNLLGAIAVALAGRVGERLAARMPAPVSRTTLLALVMALPDPLAATPRVSASTSSPCARDYGTVLVDCETRAPVDLLPEGRRPPSPPGLPPIPAWRSFAATGAAPMPTVAALAPLTPSRSPICGTSGTTSPKQ